MIKFSNILTNRTVAILAVVIAIIEVIPDISTGIKLNVIFIALLWILCAIFTWKKKFWASMFLAALAIFYIFNDIVLKIPEIREAISATTSEIEFLAPYEPYIVAFSVILELAFMLCFLCYAIYPLKSKR